MLLQRFIFDLPVEEELAFALRIGIDGTVFESMFVVLHALEIAVAFRIVSIERFHPLGRRGIKVEFF